MQLHITTNTELFMKNIVKWFVVPSTIQGYTTMLTPSLSRQLYYYDCCMCSILQTACTNIASAEIQVIKVGGANIVLNFLRGLRDCEPPIYQEPQRDAVLQVRKSSLLRRRP